MLLKKILFCRQHTRSMKLRRKPFRTGYNGFSHGLSNGFQHPEKNLFMKRVQALPIRHSPESFGKKRDSISISVYPSPIDSILSSSKASPGTFISANNNSRSSCTTSNTCQKSRASPTRNSLVCHRPLAISLTTIGSIIFDIINDYGLTMPNSEAVHLFCGSIVVWLISFFIIQHLSIKSKMLKSLLAIYNRNHFDIIIIIYFLAIVTDYYFGQKHSL